MRVALLADAHLDGPGGEAAPLLRQLRELPELGCGRLVILGDLFHVWVALPKYETVEVRAVVAALEDLRRRGVAIDYIEGNRDFFTATGPYASVFDRVGEEVTLEQGGTRVLVVHGDGLDPADRSYAVWRRLSKSGLTRAAATALPAAWGRRLFGRAERALARTNLAHKIHIPEEAVIGYGRRRLAEGHDLLLMGHFHEARRYRVPEGEIRLLDAWFATRELEWLAAEPAREAPARVER